MVIAIVLIILLIIYKSRESGSSVPDDIRMVQIVN